MEGTLYSNLTFDDLNDLVYGKTAFNIHDTRHYFLCLFKVLSLHQPAFYEPPCSLYGRQFPLYIWVTDLDRVGKGGKLRRFPGTGLRNGRRHG